MHILVTKDGYILLHAPKIEYGVFDEPFEKWALLDENDRIMMYAIDHEYTRVEVDSLPEDYEEGKYFYLNDEFVLNEDWEPYIPEEQKIDILEQTVSQHDTEIDELRVIQETNDAEMLYQICLLQLGCTDEDL